MDIAPVTIRSAVAGDAAALRDIAERTFRDTFEQHNSAADVAAHIKASYSLETQRAQIESPEVLTLLVEQHGALVGYAQLRTGQVPACISAHPVIELWHFYVDKPAIGVGIAQHMMQSVWDQARLRSARAIWLGVWERNPRAIAFYRKYGFREVGSHTFTLGSDAQTDLIMLAEVVQHRSP